MKNPLPESEPEQPEPEPRKFGWFGLREKFRILKQMYAYHSPWDAEFALRSMLWRGILIGRKQRKPSEPYCDLHNDPEFDAPLQCIAPGIFACGQCRSLNTAPAQIARPTVVLNETKNRSRVVGTGPIIYERPSFAYRRQLHPDAEAGDDTQLLRAIRLKGGEI